MRTYVLVALLGIGCGGSHSAPGDLKVTGTPTGEIAGQIHLTVSFSRPMVTHDQVGKPVAAPPLTVVPALTGDAAWSDEKTLVLAPKASLPISTRFVATVPRGTKALDGNELDEPFTFEFFTERVSASLDVIGSDARATRDQAVRVSFTQPVPLAEVIAHCHYAAGGTQTPVKNGPQSPSGPAKSYTVNPAAPLALDTAWTVSCDAGLRGVAGDLGIAKLVETKFHTYGPLHFVKLDPSGKDIVPDESVRLSLELTNPLKAPYAMTLAPAVPGFPDRCHALDDAKPGLSCAVPLDPQTSYTLTIAATQKDIFDQPLDAPQVLTFHTTDAKPALSMESGYFLAELKRPVLPVWTRNATKVDVTAVAVTPENFHLLRPLIDWWDPKPADFSKSKLAVKTRSITVTGDKNKWGQHALGAPELTGGAAGPGMFYIELASKEVEARAFADGGRKKVLVNFTDIGVVSKLSGSRGLVWATRLSTGKPLPNAAVSVRDETGRVTWSGTTDADGIAILPGTSQLVKQGKREASGLDPAGEHYAEERDGASSGQLSAVRIFVQADNDWTMVNPSRSNGLSAWNFNVSVDSDRSPVKLRGFMHTDRGLYRPGEKVHVKGLARIAKLGEALDLPGEGKKVKVTVDGPQGKTFLETEAKLSAFGGFWFDLELPGDARLGDYVVRAQVGGGTFVRDFTVEEYRTATFEVTGSAKEKSLVRKGNVAATVSANYFYGAPVRNGKVEVTVHSRSRRVSFPSYGEFEFFDERHYEGYYSESEHSQNMVTDDHLELDAKGNATLAVSVGPDDVSQDADLLIRASVTAPSNEVVSKTFTVPYFKSKTYFGIKAASYFSDVGKPQTFQIVAVGADGKPAAGPAKVTVSRRDWNCVWEDWGYRGNYQCKDSTKALVQKTLQLVGAKPTEFEFTPPAGGDYWIVVEGENDKQEVATAAQEIYAWGDGGGSWKSNDTMALEMVADKKEYKAGDTATLLFKTDLAQATGLVTIERDGVLEKRLITLSPKEKSVQVPITGAYAPNVYVSVALVQGRMGEGTRGKPRMRMGIINLPVKPEDNTLAVGITTDKADYRPGEQVTATVKVTDSAGKPVSSEVSITASDEGVLSLIGYETPNPIPTFYAQWGLGVTTATQLEYIRDIPGANQDRPATGGDAVGTIRSRFVSTAVWTPGAVTDANGIATVKFTAPDNLTAFRMMALAADRGHRFGSADKRFTVSKPLQLLSSLPRFLAVGDVLSGGVVVHNETGMAGTAIVKLITDGKVTNGGAAERTVPVPKDGRVPVLFELTAARPGKAVLDFTVTMDGEGDAVRLELPVEYPSPVQVVQVATGLAKGVTKVPVAMPANVLPSSAELVIAVDPDGLSGIDEGLRDLIQYPYGCLEQTTSKLIPMIAVRDLAESLAIDGLTGPALDNFIKAGVTKIGLHQTAYGGFSLWPGGEPDTYYTAYGLWGLYLAKQAGYRVDQTRINDGLEYLRNDGQSPNQSRPHYNEYGNQGAQAFALYVRAVLGDKAAQTAATTMSADLSKLPIYGKAFLARALAVGLGAKDPAVTKIVGELEDYASAAGKNEALIQEPQEREMWAYLSSSVRTSAVVLSALVELDPKNAVIEPLVRVVMKHRRSERYWDTQSNLYALLALTSYARTMAGSTSSVTVELGGTAVLTGALTGKQRMRVVTLPLAAAGELAITPTGPVHYSVDVRYRRTVAALTGESHGLTLANEYLDEAGKPKSTFTVGDIVRVRVSAVLKDDADNLIISDALPAGFEALNDRFVTVGPVDVPQTHEWGTYREMHDDRVNFASQWGSYGSYDHEFTIRAIAAGKFVRPPSVAELMYAPATNAQTAADYLVIKAK